jgi:hypothetical protein
MYMLIKDIDNPFDYTDGHENGGAEVPLFPIAEYIARVKKRL